MWAGACFGSVAASAAPAASGGTIGTTDWPASVDRLALDPSQRQSCGEHRQEAVGVAGEGNPIGQRDEAEGEEVIQAYGLAVRAAQVENQRPDRRAERPADPQACG